MYVSKLFDIINNHLLDAHCFADDKQLYLSCKPDSCSIQDEVILAMENSICDLRKWMFEDQLKINDGKTEFLIIGSKQQLKKLNPCHIRFGSVDIHPVSSVRNLGLILTYRCQHMM